MPYQLLKLCVDANGPFYVSICKRSEFKQLWDYAIEMFRDSSLNIVGCHYEPPDYDQPPRAEFFVAAPGIHETYVIHAASEASSA